MEIETTLEWFYFADADFDSAQILNDAYRKHGEIICYHCQQAVEKYLKAFLCYSGIIPLTTMVKTFSFFIMVLPLFATKWNLTMILGN